VAVSNMGFSMRYIQRSFVFSMVLLGSATVLDHSTRGSTIDFHRYVAQNHARTTALPKLYGHIPANVRQFTDEGAIKFWAANQHNAILRNSAFEIQLCKAVTAHRNLNPARFDRYHPVIGRLLRDPQFFDYALHLYYTHPSRFVHYHHHLIPLIRGCAMMMNMTPSSGTGPEVIQAPGSNTVSPVPGEINNGPGPTPNGPTPTPGQFNFPPTPTPVIPQVVPAPPSIVLMFFGLSYVASRRRPRVKVPA